ncbi:MAG: c-type cytochrome [Gammaproteobacteria bacterium]|nr:c-type cytochrome [Gammaproteobacteria bacterium]
MKKFLTGSAAAMLLVSGAALADGKATYEAVCSACHNPAVAPTMKSPALGNKDDWAPRIAKGMDALYNSAINGVPGTAMVAKGGNPNLSDEEVKAAVDYMVSQSK